MSSNKYHSCFKNDKTQNKKSIFDYVIDTSRFVHKNECDNFNPPFLAYIPSGVPKMNIDIDTDLKGINRPVTKCSKCKYHSQNIELVQSSFDKNIYDIYPNNKKEC